MGKPISDRSPTTPGRGQIPAFMGWTVSGLVPIRYYISLTLITWGILFLNFVSCPALKFSMFLLHQALAIGFCLILWGGAIVYLERKYLIQPVISARQD